ncbi:MAG: xanthine dehydrogenase family protein molybdopterin-binding subunit [Dehalococcoidia bacterium]|nr:xanthine dehydrogenase family protein molybdopterin-binding subunit [Dehalococcoidia bacterium]
MTTFTTIGRTLPRLEGLDKVTGKTRYTADVSLPGTLWAQVLRSPHPHARIVRIDASGAWDVPGVRAVLTAADLPQALVGRRLRDMPVLARDKVRFIGEKVAAVAAEDSDAAEDALHRIRVEYEELPAVFDPQEAASPDAPLIHENIQHYVGLPQPMAKPSNLFSTLTWRLGDTAQGFAQAAQVFEHTFRVPMVHQAYLEPHACLVSADADGSVRVWASNKTPFALRRQLAEATELDDRRIVVHATPVGGDFGGKGSFMDVPLCYFLSRQTRRPVKMVMDYYEEFIAGNPRHAGVITIRSGVDRDGNLLARHSVLYFNNGAYGAFKPVPSINLMGAQNAAGTYRIPNVLIESHCVYTNTVPGGHMRAPGEPQAIFAAESHMDEVARALGVDPLEYRRRHLVKEGDPNLTGGAWHDVRPQETLQAAADAIGWGKPKPRYVGRGIGITERHTGSGQTTASVTLTPIGAVELRTPMVDTGTGAYMTLRQVVSEVLTVPVESVSVLPQDTDQAPFDSGVGGSRVTHIGGQAAYRAAQALRQRLEALAAERLGVSPREARLSGGAFHARGRSLSLAALASSLPVGSLTAEAAYEATSAPGGAAFCAQAAEVAVDPETGQVTVLKVVSAHEVGTILNPLGHQGQIDGGVVQALGYALLEELQVQDGVVTTPSFAEYKIPTMRDIPPLETVLVKGVPGPAPYQGKAIGEHTVSAIVAAVANAVRDAVGVRVTSLPITAEKVYEGLKAQSK